MFVIKAIN